MGAIIDVDGHILEPSDLWDNNLEAQYRSRSMHFSRDEEGLEVWLVDGKPHPFLAKGTSANMTTFAKSKKWRQEHVFGDDPISWEDGRAMNPGGCHPQERTKLMDEEGIDKSILYPSLGLDWPALVDDPALGAAYCRVYNDWIIDFCHQGTDRLYPALLLPWIDISETVKELKRTADASPRVAMVPGTPINNVSYGDARWDPIWQESVDQDIPVSLHVGTAGPTGGRPLYPELNTPAWWGFTTNFTGIALSFMSFFQGAVFDRFPSLKLAVLESGCLWMPYALDGMDEKMDVLGFTTPMKLKPSEYFQRQCWISMDPDDEFGPFVINHLGADKVLWCGAYDYPHSDSPVEPVKT